MRRLLPIIFLLIPVVANSHGKHEPIPNESLHALRHERLEEEKQKRSEAEAARAARAADEAWWRAKQEEMAKDRIERELRQEQIKATKRLSACDSFGFERGTTEHANCAMQLYMNEQNQNINMATSDDGEQQKTEQKALLERQRQQLARQEAIQEAILKEQERVRRMEQSMKLIELGTGIATGSLGGRSTPKMQSHTYTINGQIINCTTTGSSTDCY